MPLGEKLACQCRDRLRRRTAGAGFSFRRSVARGGGRDAGDFGFRVGSLRISPSRHRPAERRSGGQATRWSFRPGRLTDHCPQCARRWPPIVRAARATSPAPTSGTPEAMSSAIGSLAIVHRADFRAMEIAAITGPLTGLQPVHIVEPPAPAPAPGPPVRSRRLKPWL